MGRIKDWKKIEKPKRRYGVKVADEWINKITGEKVYITKVKSEYEKTCYTVILSNDSSFSDYDIEKLRKRAIVFMKKYPAGYKLPFGRRLEI